jgi:hypothetical protein
MTAAEQGLLRAELEDMAERVTVDLAVRWVTDELSNARYKSARRALRGTSPATLDEVVVRLRDAEVRIKLTVPERKKVSRGRLNRRLGTFLRTALRPCALEVARQRMRDLAFQGAREGEGILEDPGALAGGVPLPIGAPASPPGCDLDADLQRSALHSRARDLVAELRRTLDALGLGASDADRVDRAEKLLLDALSQAESDPAASVEMTVRALRGVVAAFAVIKAPVEDHRSTIHYVTARIMELAGLVNERNSGSNNTDWLEKRQQRVRRAVARFEAEHGTGSALDDDEPPPAPSSAPAP